MILSTARIVPFSLFSCFLLPLLLLIPLLLLLAHPELAMSTFDNMTGFDDEIGRNLEIIQVISFNKTTLSAIAVDPISDLVYISVTPDYFSNYSSISCLEQNTANYVIASSSNFPCSAVYILNGSTGQINSIIKLRTGEQIHDLDIDPYSGKMFATGEYNYLNNSFEENREPVHYEDDVMYIIGDTIYSNNNNNTKQAITNDSLSQMMTTNNIERIRLYGEIEEGKEGDMSSIAADTQTKTIYAGIRYFEGGREGVFIINDNSGGNGDSKLIDIDKKPNATTNNLTNIIKFIPLGQTGPDQILVNNKTNTIYASLKNDNFVALINGSNNTIKEKLILLEPRAMSINPSAGLLYLASGDSNWFNVIDMNTSKVIAANTQIAYPIASAVDYITGKVYVVDCHLCDDYDFTNGSSIYELDSKGSTIDWKNYQNINLDENELGINPFTKKLYAIGTDLESGMSNIYVIDTSLR